MGWHSSSHTPPLLSYWAQPGAGRRKSFCLLSFHPQLFGFVFACYVSKVFLEEEDSCECLAPREQGCLVTHHPMPSAPWTEPCAPWEAGRPGLANWLLSVGEKRWRGGAGLHSQHILGCDPDIQVPSARLQHYSPLTPFRFCPSEELPKAQPYQGTRVPSLVPPLPSTPTPQVLPP